MTVAELVAKLSGLPSEARVFVADENGLVSQREIEDVSPRGDGEFELGTGWEGL